MVLTDNYPFLSIIFSLILLLGLYQIGEIIFKNKTIYRIFSEISEISFQNIFISINFILLIFYILVLYFESVLIINGLGYFILICGFYKILNSLINNQKKIYVPKIKKFESIDHATVYFVMIFLFLLSLSPNTHGDSLGYHFTVANSIYKYGKFPLDITHIHTILSGSGELLIAIGLLFGSEQFGGLVQFSGLISLFGIFKK